MTHIPKVVSADRCSRCQKSHGGMFCHLSPETAAELDSMGRLVSLPSGAVLMREEDRVDQVYMICSGLVKLSCMAKDGRTLNVKIAHEGSVLGLGAIFSSSKFEVTGEAMVPTQVKIMRRDEFLAFLRRHSDACWNATQLLADDYKSAFLGVRGLALAGVSARVARLLLDMANAATDGSKELFFNMTLTHDDIAEFASTSRETVTRTLGRFRKDQLIQIRGASVRILEPEKLAALSA